MLQRPRVSIANNGNAFHTSNGVAVSGIDGSSPERLRDSTNGSKSPIRRTANSGSFTDSLAQYSYDFPADAAIVWHRPRTADARAAIQNRRPLASSRLQRAKHNTSTDRLSVSPPLL